MLRAEEIMHITCAALGVTYEQLTGKSRVGRIVEARHTAIWFLSREGYDYVEIKTLFGMCWDSVDYIVRKIEGFVKIEDHRNAVVLQAVNAAIELRKTEEENLKK